MATIIINDDDLIYKPMPKNPIPGKAYLSKNPSGETIFKINGTPGDDTFVINLVKIPGMIFSAVGGGGADKFFPTAGTSAVIHAYSGDGVMGLHPKVGGAEKGGEIHTGPGWWAVGGHKPDMIIGHGTGASYKAHGPAEVWANPLEDTLIFASSEGWDVIGAEFKGSDAAAIKATKGILDEVTILFHDSNPLIDGQMATLKLAGVALRESGVPKIAVDWAGGKMAMHDAIEVKIGGYEDFIL